METHVKTLGILHIVFGGLGVLLAIAVLFIFGGIAGLVGVTSQMDDARVAVPILGGIGTIIFFVLLAFALPGLVAGIGLLQFRPWARILTIILSIFELIHVPFGTALGIYGLWVMLSQGTERLFAVRRPTYT
jgi:hypothetical protein